MAVVGSPTQVRSDDVLMAVWNTSQSAKVLVRGASKQQRYDETCCELYTTIEPQAVCVLSCLLPMDGEDDASVTWISMATPERKDTFLLVHDLTAGIKTVRAASATQDPERTTVAMLWDSCSPLDGLPPFKRVATFLAMVAPAPLAPSPLAIQFQNWLDGGAWPGGTPASTSSTTSVLLPDV